MTGAAVYVFLGALLGTCGVLAVLYVALGAKDWPSDKGTTPDEAPRPPVPDRGLPVLGAGARQLKRPNVTAAPAAGQRPPNGGARRSRVVELIRHTQTRA